MVAFCYVDVLYGDVLYSICLRTVAERLEWPEYPSTAEPETNLKSCLFYFYKISMGLAHLSLSCCRINILIPLTGGGRI
jgi:hypothetical protein